MALVGTQQRSPQMIFQNRLLRSLLFQIPKILQQTPCPATKGITSGAPIEILVRVHGDFTGRMATRSEKIIKAIIHLFVFTILTPIISFIAPT